MIYAKAFVLLFSILVTLPGSASVTDEEGQASTELRRFQWSRLVRDTPPCPTFECRLTWAALAMALGDAGGYARRLKAAGMQEYALSNGVRQNFDVVSKLEALRPAMPWHFSGQSQIVVENDLAKQRAEAPDLAVDSRIFIKILVNGVPTDVIFDSGATLTLPMGSGAAKTLDPIGISTNNKSGLGKIEINSFAIANDVSIAGMHIKNLMAKRKEGLSDQDINAVGLLGYDLLLRYDAVTVDLRSGVIKFNPSVTNIESCSPMELVIDNNRIPAGLSTDLQIDNIPFKARIDTGANVDVVLHGKYIMPWKIGRPLRIMAVDSGGNTAPLEEFEGNVSLDKATPAHTILRSPYPHDDFKVTLGIKFFIGHSFTFDFKNSRFCLD